MSNTESAYETKTWVLPIFLTNRNKYIIGIITFALAAVFYLPSNHIHLFEPRLLPMWWIDKAIPFMPNTVWIYISEYVLFGAAYLLCKDMINANKYIYSFLALQIISNIIFWLWPTTYPREQFPLPEDLNAITYYVFNSLRETDTPANCCPSLHVSSVYLSSFIYLDDQTRKFPLFFLWATLIAVSTLTTKQHYLIDVIIGFIIAVICYQVFHKYIQYKKRFI
ncbi:MAG: phosphatase PAP2 family protein [Bdellovibrionota bacterium]